MSDQYEIRLITENDVSDALDIYKPYVLKTAITFEYAVPSIKEFSLKISTITSEYPWLVCILNDKIAGYAYASAHRPKAAYIWSPESTIYIDEKFQGKGIGTILYQALFEILKLQGFYNVYAGLAIPNEKSEKLHRTLGFQDIGTFKQIGFKLGNWHDTKWFQLTLQDHIMNPPMPQNIHVIAETIEFRKILEKYNRHPPRF